MQRGWVSGNLAAFIFFLAFMPLMPSFAIFPDDVAITIIEDDPPKSDDVELNDFGVMTVLDDPEETITDDDSLETALSDDDDESTQLPGVELDDLDALSAAVQASQVKATVKVTVKNQVKGPASRNRGRAARSWCGEICVPTVIGVGLYLVFASLALAIPTAFMIIAADHSQPSLSDHCFPICNSRYDAFYIPKNNTLIPAFCNGTILHDAQIKIEAADLKALSLSRYTAVPSYKGVPICDVVKDWVADKTDKNEMPSLVPMTKS